MSEPAPEASSRGTGAPAPEDPGLVQALRARGPGEVVFGRFRLQRELGAGGMAVVWLAHDERLGLPVALKFLAGMVATDAEAIDDLRREITRGLRLTHPGIVRIYDLHEDPATRLAAIAMEYVDGPSLAEEKSRQPDRCFDPGEPLCSWLRTLCEVLEYVHDRARVVHRDLKPRNLMLNSSGELKVTDFGIAATLGETHTRLTQQANTSGTPAYMSPQQVMGQAPSASDDIYALGATLYELLTSKPPFFRGTMTAILGQVTTQTPVTMEERRRELGILGRSEIPREWEETVAACLAKEPEERPASAREVAERLGLYAFAHVPSIPASEPPVLEEAAPEEPVAIPPARGSSSAGWIVVLVLVLAAAGAGALTWGRGRFGPAAADAPAPPVAATPEVTPLRAPHPVALATPVAARVTPLASAPKRVATPQPTSAPTPWPAENATLEKPYVNSLGMRFVPVPINSGKAARHKVLFSVWDTRVQDYEAFVKATGHPYTPPTYPQGPTHPVSTLGWRDAHQFCVWLANQEGLVYRLPRDHEWSCAVGIGDLEDPNLSAEAKDGKAPGYPWGNTYPPSAKVGNYAPMLKVDDFEYTSPVGSFFPNRYGLYDMGGNVWQWCRDLDSNNYVLRGGAWFSGTEVFLRSSSRGHSDTIHTRGDARGFRCVIDLKQTAP